MAKKRSKSSKSSATPIVSSSHLLSGDGSLNAFEFGLVMAGHAFSRWTVRCMAAAGMPELSGLDVMVLHHVNHRDRAKRISDICFVLNIEDTHTVTYSLKKMAKLELVDGQRHGKEVHYAITDPGRALCERYREVREECLVAAMNTREVEDLEQVAQTLRALSGLYDQAARAAASM